MTTTPLTITTDNEKLLIMFTLRRFLREIADRRYRWLACQCSSVVAAGGRCAAAVGTERLGHRVGMAALAAVGVVGELLIARVGIDERDHRPIRVDLLLLSQAHCHKKARARAHTHTHSDRSHIL
jgi:hypothetical protein